MSALYRDTARRCGVRLDRWPLAPAWALVAGPFFGVTVHVANVLPDLLDDQAKRYTATEV
jgi:hypothetical protein